MDIQEVLRVNHAGEYGACCIYKGQMSVLGANDKNLQHMYQQEQEHLKKFTKLMIENKVRPTIMQPIWHALGFALGVGSALIGRNYAHTCTIAVEEVIEEHYQHQLDNLTNNNDELTKIKMLILECQNDEIEHKNLADNLGGKTVKNYHLVRRVIRDMTKLAITISKKI